jgi:large subunit ribosomal protein L9
MKVILLQDVARVGRKHEILEVPDGHAHNYLIPRKLAALATRGNVKWQETRDARMETASSAAAKAFGVFLARIGETPVVIAAAANERGHLFKGLRAADVAKALSDASGVTIAPAAIALEVPIKDVGEYPVAVSALGREGTVSISVQAK